ncbi:hypothetical protein [Desulfovibrio desulfuricans]|uniref:hypothetical protein n=1 Tax=Desulfovibrio desulfuricans TaxID=876 RepID=UPI00131DA270|nr:hypothetical protein [Desulfovibrio desulfuricans]MDD3682647.1 hypothetical protein [Desulfovibrio desulfuricans]QTO40605.1 hypothetical protein J8J02_01365 [Desulfovibrio desulfuricans]
MDSITSASNNSVQPSNMSATTNGTNVSKKNDSSELQQGDTVTISEEGKKLSKSVDKSDENEPSTNSDSGLTVSNMKISQQLQDAKDKQKQLTAKIAEEKAQGNDVSALNAQLSDAQQNVKKFQNKADQ